MLLKKSEKILFLPHCLREDSLNKIQKFAKSRNYDVYVLPGGSMMEEIMKKYSLKTIEKIVGVACEKEIPLAMDYFFQLGIVERVIPIELSKKGCKNTEVDLKKVFDVL